MNISKPESGPMHYVLLRNYGDKTVFVRKIRQYTPFYFYGVWKRRFGKKIADCNKEWLTEAQYSVMMRFQKMDLLTWEMLPFVLSLPLNRNIYR